VHDHLESVRLVVVDGQHVDQPEHRLENQSQQSPGHVIGADPIPVLFRGGVLAVQVVEYGQHRQQEAEVGDRRRQAVELQAECRPVEPPGKGVAPGHGHQPRLAPGDGIPARRQHAAGDHVDQQSLDEDVHRVSVPQDLMPAGTDLIPAEPVAVQEKYLQGKGDSLEKQRPPVDVEEFLGEGRLQGDEEQHPGHGKGRPGAEEHHVEQRHRARYAAIALFAGLKKQGLGDQRHPGTAQVQVGEEHVGKHHQGDDDGAPGTPHADLLDGQILLIQRVRLLQLASLQFGRRNQPALLRHDVKGKY
jgi:hypothetical protein